MSRVSADHPHSRPCYGGKSLRRCRNSVNTDNPILIDVDSDYFDNIIIIDVPDSESFPKNFRGPSTLRKDKTQSFTNVINIDDDDDGDDDETPDKKHSGVGVNKSSFCAEASSSRNFSRAGDAAADEQQFFQENVTPVRLSKCKRTYSGKASTTNHYGLDTDSETESDASDSDDFPDCDLMVDCSGKVQEQWEKAFFRRKKEMNKSDSGVNRNQDQSPFSSSTKKMESSNGYEASSSRMNVDADFDIQDPNINACLRSDSRAKDSPVIHTKLDEQKDHEPESSRRNTEAGQENTSLPNSIHQEQPEAEEVFRTSPPFMATTTPAFNATAAPPFKGTATPAFKGTATPAFTGTATPAFTATTNHPFTGTATTAFKGTATPAFKGTATPPFTDTATPPFTDTATPPFTDTATPAFKATATPAFKATATPAFKATMHKCHNSFESGVGSGSSFLKENLMNFQERTTSSDKKKVRFKPSQPCAAGRAKEKENLVPDISSFNCSKAPDQQTNPSFFPSSGAPGSVSGKSYFSTNLFGNRSDNGKGFCQENRPPVSEIPLNEAEFRKDDSVQSSVKKGDKDDRCQSEDDVPSDESPIISEREKLKETDEYKKAMEEEWASRQQTLQIQAEEAQCLKRLKKRKKAETLRLLDMEKRQKQRLEEIRTSQKKDEESMNLKEVVRAEVRKDLQKLELSCKNMSSLLHCLGVRMTGWPNPPPQQVQAAYKKALLTFHPDRASRSDIRQQVEAEEKFKLVNRLKEKFSLSL